MRALLLLWPASGPVLATARPDQRKKASGTRESSNSSHGPGRVPVWRIFKVGKERKFGRTADASSVLLHGCKRTSTGPAIRGMRHVTVRGVPAGDVVVTNVFARQCAV